MRTGQPWPRSVTALQGALLCSLTVDLFLDDCYGGWAAVDLHGTSGQKMVRWGRGLALRDLSGRASYACFASCVSVSISASRRIF